MILEWLGLPTLWDSIVDFFTISPFWYYLFWGVVISAGVTFAAWFFPPLRTLSGAIVVAISTGLYAYRRGEKDTEARIKKRQERQARRAETQHQGPFDWLFGPRK